MRMQTVSMSPRLRGLTSLAMLKNRTIKQTDHSWTPVPTHTYIIAERVNIYPNIYFRDEKRGGGRGTSKQGLVYKEPGVLDNEDKTTHRYVRHYFLVPKTKNKTVVLGLVDEITKNKYFHSCILYCTWF